MRRILLHAVSVALLASSTVLGQISAGGWAKAGAEIRRIAPAEYSGLPRSISRYLTRHGYTIPQSYGVGRQHNVLQGRFDSDVRKDWAVLASRKGYSQILLFWGGSPAKVSVINREEDAMYLQATGEDTIGYSRRIDTVNGQYILEHYRRYGGPIPPPIRHDAIDDGFTGKASGVWYFDGRKWYALQGAD